ncbi:hypothetical protein PG985_009995 [Apiospora marii]|uniref:uncharacterized protein n=1 Tax=Apiospora marii TaxID=335849 RepID=UPI0031322835
MQRGRPSRTPSLSSSLADSRSPSPYARSGSRSRPPYPNTTTTHQNNVRWSTSVSPDDPLRSRGSHPQHYSSRRREESFAPSRSPTPQRQQEKERVSKKRRSSVSFLKDQIKEKMGKDEDATTATKADLKEKAKEGGKSTLKASLMFLGSVAAATYVANRFWPRGFPYGEKEEWEEARRPDHHRRRTSRAEEEDEHRRPRRRRSTSQRRRYSVDHDEEGRPEVYRRGRPGSVAERVVYGEEPIRRAPSRGFADEARYTVVGTVSAERGFRPVSGTRQEAPQRYLDDGGRGGDHRRSSSSSSRYYYDGGDRYYYATTTARRRGDDDEGDVEGFREGRRGSVCREPRYVEHQVTTLRRSSSDEPYTTTERVVRRQYHLDDR